MRIKYLAPCDDLQGRGKGMGLSDSNNRMDPEDV